MRSPKGFMTGVLSHALTASCRLAGNQHMPSAPTKEDLVKVPFAALHSVPTFKRDTDKTCSFLLEIIVKNRI